MQSRYRRTFQAVLESERVSFIADAVLRDVDAYSLLDDARGETTFDTEDPFYRKFEAFLINLIPFGSAIKNFINGNSAQGVIDLSMDVLGFALAFVGGGSLAKGLAAVKGAGKVAQVAKIVGRAALGALNPLGGIGDLVVGGIKSLKNGLKNIEQWPSVMVSGSGWLSKALPR